MNIPHGRDYTFGILRIWFFSTRQGKARQGKSKTQLDCETDALVKDAYNKIQMTSFANSLLAKYHRYNDFCSRETIFALCPIWPNIFLWHVSLNAFYTGHPVMRSQKPDIYWILDNSVKFFIQFWWNNVILNVCRCGHLNRLELTNNCVVKLKGIVPNYKHKFFGNWK